MKGHVYITATAIIVDLYLVDSTFNLLIVIIYYYVQLATLDTRTRTFTTKTTPSTKYNKDLYFNKGVRVIVLFLNHLMLSL